MRIALGNSFKIAGCCVSHQFYELVSLRLLWDLIDEVEVDGEVYIRMSSEDVTGRGVMRVVVEGKE